MTRKQQKFNVQDLVENQSYERRPKLWGIIVEEIGWDDQIDDYIYRIFSFQGGKARSYMWPEYILKKIS